MTAVWIGLGLLAIITLLVSCLVQILSGDRHDLMAAALLLAMVWPLTQCLDHTVTVATSIGVAAVFDVLFAGALLWSMRCSYQSWKFGLLLLFGVQAMVHLSYSLALTARDDLGPYTAGLNVTYGLQLLWVLGAGLIDGYDHFKHRDCGLGLRRAALRRRGHP